MILHSIATTVMQTNDYSKLFIWGIKLYLMVILLWPPISFAVKTISTIIQASILTFVSIGLILHLNDNTNNFGFGEAANVMCMMMIYIMSTYKLIVVWYKSDELKDVFNIILTEFWPYDLMNGESNKQTKEMYNLMNTIKWAFIGGSKHFRKSLLLANVK
uniref:Uncharacterized protein LOC114328902 n=1 Tax=Diabrotica virgifera virgifera TaxID=50390 RepID=A0A6P7FDC4_DIAVI